MIINPVIKEIIEWLYCIIVAILLAVLVRYYIGTPTIVKQPSMYPTLKQDQRLILDRLSRTFHTELKRGDIVTFEAPSKTYISKYEADFQNPVAIYNYNPKGFIERMSYYVLEYKKISYIKRVIGLPGEHVKIENGAVYINGVKLQEDYLQNGVITENKDGVFSDFIVPEGTVFLMGDNREKSTDSRKFGCIPLKRIESKVWVRVWPIDVFGKVN